MLYATTRNSTEAYTAQYVLSRNRGPDGGLFVPFRIPQLTQEEVLALGKKSFNECLTDALNRLFGVHLTAFDADFSLGRQPVRLHAMGQKILVAECWHNTDWIFSRLIQDVARLLNAEPQVRPETKGWTELGVRIAVLFGIFGKLIRENRVDFQRKMDISLVSGDFSGPMAGWYAREMGLPIGNIVCCCNENGNTWEFFNHGQLRTETVAVQTVVPEGDVAVPEGLERLIGFYGGQREVERYVDALRRGTTYYVDDGLLSRMRQGFYATVSSQRRILDTIPGVYSAHNYLLAPDASLAYGGLQDYRSQTGQMPPALILAEKSPELELRLLSDATGVPENVLKKGI